MSITNTKAKSVYNANGTTTEWNLGFTYDDTVSNVHIYIVDANDNETKITSNYSIADGVLTYPTTDSGLEPLAEGNKLVIVRDTPRTQDIELTSNGKLDGKVLEGGYDKLTLQVQELTEQVNRAVKFPVTEDSADNFLDPITAITEAKKEALVEIEQATTPAETAKETAVAKAQVATEQATIATNAATSAKAAQVGAEQAEQNATAQAEKAENAVTAFVEGLGISKNAVIDLGTFYGKTSVTSSRIIEFDKKPVAVSLRFSDTNKKLWINGTNSTVGIEVIDNTHCNLFYSIASADFVGQNAVKGPFVVQAIIQYAVLDNVATETEMGAVQLATKAEAEAGTNDTKAMTPLKTKYAIEANATVQTLRNDIDGLSEQVSVIEGKIPQAASDSNQLVDKASMTSAIAVVQKGIDDNAGDITALQADLAGKQDKGDYATNAALTTGLNQKADKADSLSGYGITDAFTKEEVNAELGKKADKATTYSKTEVDNAINSLQMIKWVDTLPATGETKYLYAVAREEVDKDGKKIAALYLWDGSAWRGAGAFSLNIDPNTLATKAELAGYLPLASKAVANGVASLDANAKVPVAQIPDLSSTYATINSLATVATSGSYNDLTGTPGAATADTLGLVKPDGNTITVTEDGTISATGGSGSGSGFDFEGTKAEFDAAVAAGTITEDSVSLITDDVSGDNVATKAELQAVDSSKADTSLSNLSTAGKALASGLGMPSNRHIDLTLGASGSSYTAPANGYFCLKGNSGINGDFKISFYNQTANFRQTVSDNNWADWVSTYIPAKKGDVVNLLYANVTAASHSFLFIYAEGAE